MIALHELGMRYGEKRVFSGLNAMIRAGQCVCLIGANGCGKTTLLKILTGAEQPTAGTFKIGAGVRLGYYAQNTYDLNDNNTVFGEMNETFPLMEIKALRNALAAFLFRVDEIEKRIGTLSGGEKARLRLLKLVLSGANVLLLDEPTNHLDIASAEMLETALERFEGTVLIVTHDRYLVRRLADRVLLLTEDGIVEQTDEEEDLFERIRETKPEKKRPENAPDNAYFKRKEHHAKLVQAKQEVHRIERLIGENEANRKQTEQALLTAQETNEYREMQRLYETLSTLDAEETSLYEQLEAAEQQVSDYEAEERI